jgi:hypothetical protein
VSLPGIDPFVGAGVVVVAVALLLLWVFGWAAEEPEELDDQ